MADTGLLKTWQTVGDGGIARFAGIKQVNEIQLFPGSPPTMPIYLRRRITYASLQIELDYDAIVLNSIPAIHVWLAGVWVPLKDYSPVITWKEPGSAVLNSLAAIDDDGTINAYSGCWVTDGKEIQSVGEGSVTVICTWRNEGEWILDADR